MLNMSTARLLSSFIGAASIASGCAAQVDAHDNVDGIESSYYAKAYDCYERKEYVCAAYHFDLSIESGEILDEKAEQKARIDHAYSLFLIDHMKGINEIAPMFDKRANLLQARARLQEANYSPSYLLWAVNMELVYIEGWCSVSSKSLISENQVILTDRDSILDREGYEVEALEAIQHAANEADFELSQCPL
nr:hypothetical protein [Hyphomonas sp. Mor2]